MPVGLFDTFHNHQNLVLRLGVDFAAMSQGTPRQKVPRSPLYRTRLRPTSDIQ